MQFDPEKQLLVVINDVSTLASCDDIVAERRRGLVGAVLRQVKILNCCISVVLS
jgi:hypothetical protein